MAFTDNDTLGKFNENVQFIAKRIDEHAAAKLRIVKLEADLFECAEYFKDHCDVVDGDYGEHAPNKEMRLYSMIQETLYGPGNF